MTQVIGSLSVMWQVETELLVLALPSPNYCRHWESEPAHSSICSVSACLSASLSLAYIKPNKYNKMQLKLAYTSGCGCIV